MTRALWTIDHTDGTGSRFRLPAVDVTPRCQRIIDRHLDGLDPDDAADLACLAAERRADLAAYRREAQRRGLLW